MFADGVLVPVGSLCNGVTIHPVAAARVAYHHIETETHTAVFAEGLACETYLDTGNRAAFDGRVTALHPRFAGNGGFAPRVTEGPAVHPLRRRLLARVPARRLQDSELHLLADGVRIDPAAGGVELPPGTTSLRIVSRCGVPAHVTAETSDDRTLGIALARLELDGIDVLHHPALLAGWHASEGGWRWTDGDATVPAALLAGIRHVRLEVVAAATYWDAPRKARWTHRARA